VSRGRGTTRGGRSTRAGGTGPGSRTSGGNTTPGGGGQAATVATAVNRDGGSRGGSTSAIAKGKANLGASLNVSVPGEAGTSKTSVLLKGLGARLVRRKDTQDERWVTTASPSEQNRLALNRARRSIKHERLAQSGRNE